MQETPNTSGLQQIRGGGKSGEGKIGDKTLCPYPGLTGKSD